MPTKIYASPDLHANAAQAVEAWEQHQDHSIYRNPRGACIVLRVEPATHIPAHWQLVSPEELEHQLLHLDLEPEEDIPCPARKVP